MNLFKYITLWAALPLAGCTQATDTSAPLQPGPTLLVVANATGDITSLRRGMTVAAVTQAIAPPDGPPVVRQQFHTNVPEACYVWDISAAGQTRFIHAVFDGNSLTRLDDVAPFEACPPFG